jgi:hypothetical protein
MSDSEKLPTDEQSPEPTLPSDADIGHLSVIAIHMNELFTHLKKNGFNKEEALHLTGMVLSSGILFKYDSHTDATLDIEDESDFDDLDGEDFV